MSYFQYCFIIILTVVVYASCAKMQTKHPFCEDYIAVQFKGMTICVSPDYYTAEDGIRTPLGYSDALALADRLDQWLPTTEMVDAIYKQAAVKLAPIPMPPTAEMTSRAYYITHNQLINNQLADSGYSSKKALSTMLVAGHKKDVIAIDRNSTNVGIYGWHLTDSTVIQPFSTVHKRDYFDYSHGIRLIKKNALSSSGEVVELASPY